MKVLKLQLIQTNWIPYTIIRCFCHIYIYYYFLFGQKIIEVHQFVISILNFLTSSVSMKLSAAISSWKVGARACRVKYWCAAFSPGVQQPRARWVFACILKCAIFPVTLSGYICRAAPQELNLHFIIIIIGMEKAESANSPERHSAQQKYIIFLASTLCNCKRSRERGVKNVFCKALAGISQRHAMILCETYNIV